MKIVIDKDVIGELTDDGEIITDDIWLKKPSDRIKKRKPMDLRRAWEKGVHTINWFKFLRVILATLVL